MMKNEKENFKNTDLYCARFDSYDVVFYDCICGR